MSVIRSLSVVQLILLAFVAVVLPLVWAVLTALYQVDGLVEKNSDAIVKIKQEALISRSLSEHLTSMERSASQYHILGDKSLQEGYLNHRISFRLSINEFMQNRPIPKLLDLVKRIDEQEQYFFSLILVPPSVDVIANTESLLVDLHQLIQTLISETDIQLSDQIDFLSDEARGVKQKLLFQAILALPITILFGLLFVVLITKPIRQLDHTVRRLGQGVFDQDVHIGGPHDLQVLGQRLNWLSKQLRDIEQQKDAFLRNISHELKTPLASIREGTELLMVSDSHVSADEQQEIIQILKESSLSLQHLIEGLLHFNELTAGNNSIENIDFEQLINDVITPYQLSIANKKLLINRNIGLPMVAGNYHQVKLIVDNLFSNAVKFSPDDGLVNITITMAQRCVQISIEDSGPGIPASDIHKVCDLFYRGQQLTSSPLTGSGLGLAIVKEMAARSQGDVEILNANQGLYVEVKLPINEGGVLYYDS